MAFENPLPPFNVNDPHASFVNSSCFELLLIELVPMSFRSIKDTSRTEENALEEEEQKDEAFRKLESLGYRVGQGLVERFSRDRPRFIDTLDVIKFLCKDLWTLAFRKQIDNLKTNHRGVYVLTDSMFRPFVRMSCPTPADATARAQPYLWFPCGIIRGALASLGIKATVQAETTELPSAVFQIKTLTGKA